MSVQVSIVSILTRGKPRVERKNGLRWVWYSPFQSSLEGNPEWNRKPEWSRSRFVRFNPHSRETPSGTTAPADIVGTPKVSILTRGKPRVEHPPLQAVRPLQVSILTRGKPRVERPLEQLEPPGAGFNPHSRETPSGTLKKQG